MKNGEDASEPDGVETMEGHIRKVIPFKSDNSDYQKYLKWAETNTAEPAD